MTFLESFPTFELGVFRSASENTLPAGLGHGEYLITTQQQSTCYTIKVHNDYGRGTAMVNRDEEATKNVL
jgi:hypothetical protein